HRIDVAADQVTAVVTKHVIVAAERHDSRFLGRARELCEFVGPEPTAGNDSTRFDCTSRRFQKRARGPLANRADLVARANLRRALTNVFSIGGGNPSIVDDPGIGREQRLDARCVWLNLLQLVGVDNSETWTAVLLATLIQVVEPR